jgi:hypothetical protein
MQVVLSLIVKSCWEILQQLQQHKSSIYFLEPVDPIALGIPDYPKVVKNPMDFRTIGTKLKQRGFECLSKSTPM